MRHFYDTMPNGYSDSIQKGLDGLRHFRGGVRTGRQAEALPRLKKAFAATDAIVIGGGAGLSASAGLTYSGERFTRYFSDFAEAFGITDMYSGGFYPFPDEETRWAWWARHIYYNRYVEPPKPVYRDLFALVQDRDYFVITTNVDHQFRQAGFGEDRLFCTQGDYGLFRSIAPSPQLCGNAAWVMAAMEAQGFVKGADGVFALPADGNVRMRIPGEMIPHAPGSGAAVTMHLRADDSFLEEESWHRASAAYADFLAGHSGRSGLSVLYLELGVGANTPAIIKYPFWQMTFADEKAVYACINTGEAFCPEEIGSRSICIDGDIGAVLTALQM